MLNLLTNTMREAEGGDCANECGAANERDEDKASEKEDKGCRWKPVELVEDFLNLREKIGNTESDRVERESKGWVACHGLRSVWKSDHRKTLKVCFVIAALEFVLV